MLVLILYGPGLWRASGLLWRSLSLLGRARALGSGLEQNLELMCWLRC